MMAFFGVGEVDGDGGVCGWRTTVRWKDKVGCG